VAQLTVEVLEVAQVAGKEEVLADVAERALDLAPSGGVATGCFADGSPEAIVCGR